MEITVKKLMQELSGHNAEFEAEADGNDEDEDTIDVRFDGEVELGSISRPEAGEAAVVLKYRDY